MSITFSTSEAPKIVKVYCKDRWPALDDSDFSAGNFAEDEGGFYFYESGNPGLTLSNVSGMGLLEVIGEEVDYSGCIIPEDVPDLQKRVADALNHASSERLREALNNFQMLVFIAKDKGCGISWGLILATQGVERMSSKDDDLVKKYQGVVASFRKDVCERSSEVDPEEEYDWYDLSLGFFLAKGVPVKEAKELSRIVRYTFQYWC